MRHALALPPLLLLLLFSLPPPLASLHAPRARAQAALTAPSMLGQLLDRAASAAGSAADARVRVGFETLAARGFEGLTGGVRGSAGSRGGVRARPHAWREPAQVPPLAARQPGDAFASLLRRPRSGLGLFRILSL